MQPKEIIEPQKEEAKDEIPAKIDEDKDDDKDEEEDKVEDLDSQKPIFGDIPFKSPHDDVVRASIAGVKSMFLKKVEV